METNVQKRKVSVSFTLDEERVTQEHEETLLNIIADERTPGKAFILSDKHSMDERIDGIDRSITWLKDTLKHMQRTDKKLEDQMNIIIRNIRNEPNGKKLTRSASEIKYEETEEKHSPYIDDMVLCETTHLNKGLYFNRNKRATWAI